MRSTNQECIDLCVKLRIRSLETKNFVNNGFDNFAVGYNAAGLDKEPKPRAFAKRVHRVSDLQIFCFLDLRSAGRNAIWKAFR
jgi:hypothetical protein